MSLTRSGTGCL